MASGQSTAPRQHFPKKERLCAKTDIARLLDKGRYFTVGGVFRVCLLKRKTNATPGEASPEAQRIETTQKKSVAEAMPRLLISVPKRHFKRAVKRNLLKRRIREAYRRNKPSLPVDMMLIYLPAEVLDYGSIVTAMREVKERAEGMKDRSGEEAQVPAKEAGSQGENGL